MKILVVVLMMLVASGVLAQGIPDMALKENFASQVKSVDEFIARFNGMEVNPVVKNDSNWRVNNLVSLFNYEMGHCGLSDSSFKLRVQEFVDTIIKKGIKLDITSPYVWAEAEASLSVEGKEGKFILVLQNEPYKNERTRWAIMGVKGLVENGVIDTTHYYPINPIEHEIHFMSLDNVFRHSRFEIMGYRGKNIPIDELSVFMTMVMLDKIRFKAIDNLIIHFMNIPGYVFTIEEYGRSGNNSGWLISDFLPLIEEDKNKYIKKLMGK